MKNKKFKKNGTFLTRRVFGDFQRTINVRRFLIGKILSLSFTAEVQHGFGPRDNELFLTNTLVVACI